MASRKARTYMRVVFETPAAIADEAASLLVAHGALGCAVAKTIKNHLGRRTTKIVRLEAWFEELSSAALRRIMKALEAGEMLARTDAPKRERIVDPGWATKWKGRFEPFEAGNFLIVPPWNRAENGNLTHLVIQPGQAFGTGHHGTTYGALHALGSLMARRPVEAALDVGTGSGILAIAMAKSGMAKVIAIDIDPVALENARENAALNGVDGRIRFSAMPLASVRGRFNLITANILSSILIEMAAQMKRHLAADGRLILGGILAREAKEVLAAYRPQLRRVSSRIDRGWSTLVLGR
jgi:ribosomal protein L11 methyltransferase